MHSDEYVDELLYSIHLSPSIEKATTTTTTTTTKEPEDFKLKVESSSRNNLLKIIHFQAKTKYCNQARGSVFPN
jgi:hypothetical protein